MDKSKKLGVSSMCKECAKAYQKQRRQDNARHISEQRKANRLERLDEVHSIEREYYKNNIEVILARGQEYYERNKEYILTRNKSYAKTDKGKNSITATRHKRRASGNISVEDISLLKAHNKICFWCKTPLYRGVVHIDHFYPVALGGTNDLCNLVLACQTCNLRKAAKNPEDFCKIIGKDTTKLFEEDFHEW